MQARMLFHEVAALWFQQSQILLRSYGLFNCSSNTGLSIMTASHVHIKMICGQRGARGLNWTHAGTGSEHKSERWGEKALGFSGVTNRIKFEKQFMIRGKESTSISEMEENIYSSAYTPDVQHNVGVNLNSTTLYVLLTPFSSLHIDPLVESGHLRANSAKHVLMREHCCDDKSPPSQRTGNLQPAGLKDKNISMNRNCSVLNFLYLEEHGAVLVRVGRLNVVWFAGVPAACGAQDHAFPRLPLQTPGQAAAARTELLRLLEPGVLQDALGERSSQAALTGAAAEDYTCASDTDTY